MCGGGGGGGGSDAVDYQREQERKRQQQIQQGKAQLDRIFADLEGDTYQQVSPIAGMSEQDFGEAVRQALAGNVVSRDVNLPGGQMEQNYTYQYLNDAGTSALRDLGISGNLIGATDPDAYTKLYGQIYNSPNTWEKVEDTHDPIWAQQQQAYLDFANPQLNEQYGGAREDLAYALMRQGQGSSSLAGERYGDLTRDFQIRQQDVAEQARGYANQARSNVADQKQSLLTMLNSTADAGAAANAARSQVAALSATPQFSSLGPLFQNTTAGLAAGLQGNQQYQQGQRLNSIIYGGDPDQGTGRVVR